MLPSTPNRRPGCRRLRHYFMARRVEAQPLSLSVLGRSPEANERWDLASMMCVKISRYLPCAIVSENLRACRTS